MLTCRDIADSATSYMDRTMTLRERLQFRAHLLMCAFCRLYVRQLTMTRDALRLLPRRRPSDADSERLLHLFRSRGRHADRDPR